MDTLFKRYLLLALGLLAITAYAWRAGWIDQAKSYLMGLSAAPSQSAAPGGANPRQPRASAASATSPGQPPQGLLRKCRDGKDVLYTNQVCPPGTQEQAVTGVVNVIDNAAGLPAAPSTAPGTAR